MPRPKIELDPELIFDLSSKGMKKNEMASYLGISVQTLTKRMGEIRAKQGILTEYRDLQSLQLTELQFKILENITEEKIAEAPLDALVRAFKILKDKEQVIEGKPNEIHGLVAYLVELDKLEEKAEGGGSDAIDVEFEEVDKNKNDPESPHWDPDI